ncbi:HAD family hydrolase [Georgenia alba]|uniref:HAD family hydrolase n=1 Tax=Georgenia alba TaxID=2233858 RepID=A0ABW2Q5K4_9MICO
MRSSEGTRPLSERAAAWRAEIPGSLPHAGRDLMVALDIDGTLLTHAGEISPEVRSAVADVRDAGAHVVLATGRSIQATVPVAEELGLTDTYAVTSNGAVSLWLGDGRYEITDVITFDPGPTVRLLREELPEALFAVEDLGRGFKVTAPFPMGELSGDLEVVDVDELVSAPATRVTVRAPDLGSDDFHELVERVGLHGVGYAVGWSAWLDITPEGVSKASGLETLRGRLDVPPGATVAIGDGGNDLEMLGWAAHGVAMGDAAPHVMAVADAVTAGVAEDGVAVVLRALLAR